MKARLVMAMGLVATACDGTLTQRPSDPSVAPPQEAPSTSRSAAPDSGDAAGPDAGSLRVDADAFAKAHPSTLFEADGKLWWSGAATDSPSMVLEPIDTGRLRSFVTPDAQRIVFLRPAMDGEATRADLWIADLERRFPELLLKGESQAEVAAREAKSDYASSRTGIQNTIVSPDGSSVYFEAEAWRLDCSVQSVDLATKSVRFVAQGRGLVVIREGARRGSLLLSHWRREATPGRAPISNPFCELLGPDGKVLAPIGWFEDGTPDARAFCTLDDSRVRRLVQSSR